MPIQGDSVPKPGRRLIGLETVTKSEYLWDLVYAAGILCQVLE